MQKQIVLYFSSFVYFAVVAYALYVFHAGLLTTALFMFGIPAYLLARLSAAPGVVLLSVASLGVGLSVILEGLANIYGLWHTVGFGALRIFGIVQLEMLFANVLQVLFLVLLYELIFDDGVYTASSARERFSAFGLFAFSSIILIALFNFLFASAISVAHLYVWVTIILVLASVFALLVYRALTVRMVNRLRNFALIAAYPLFLNTVLAAANGHTVFNTDTYFGKLPVFGTSIPFEQLLLIFAIPIFIATVYELYLDDRS